MPHPTKGRKFALVLPSTDTSVGASSTTSGRRTAPGTPVGS